MKVVVSRRIPEAGLDRLRREAEVVVLQTDEEQAPDRDAFLAAARDADVLVTLLSESVDRQILAANPRLLGVAQMAVGYDNLDLAVATELGIPMSNTPGVLTETTADFTWAMLLAVARRVPEAHAYTAAGRFRIWGPNLFLGGDVGPGADGVRKVLGIVGYGRIGEAVARRAVGFGLRILAYGPRSRERIDADPKVEWADLDELLATADFVTLHTPLSDETRHLIDAAALARMRSTAYLINAARGPVVDEAALVAALRDRVIA
ncbi:MAG: D-glycerate dehydrogenase, partial [Acidobacteriota bacterium]